MKKLILFGATMFASLGFVKAQVAAYSFAQTAGTYNAITGGTIIATATGNSGTAGLDNIVYNLPAGTFPFTFNFNGIGYTGCNITTNGFITFGTTAPGTANYTPISSTTGYAGAISAWGGDLDSFFNIGTPAQTGELRVEVVGIAPNREVVIQYKNWRPTWSSSTTNVYGMNFQIRLAETTDIVSIVYGPGQYFVGSTSISSSRQIGLRGATNADFNNRTNSTSVQFGSSTAGTTNSSSQAFNTTASTPGMPANGLTYQWTPPQPCSGFPSSNTVVASSTVVCSGSNATLSLNSPYSLTGLTYQWSTSTSSVGPFSAVTGATLASFTATNITTALWYQAEISCGASTTSATPVQISILSAPIYTPLPFLEAFDNVWQNRCDVRNVPVTANWSSSPTTGNPSWRRQNDGSSANWTAASTGTVAPIGAGCADFHSYYASTNATGNLDLYLDLSAPGNNVLSFYNYNASGSDSLLVYLSTNGGSTFSKIGGYNTATSWTKQNITIGSVVSPSCVVRFMGKSDYGNDDIGLDSVEVKIINCVTPPFAGVISGPTNVSTGTTNSFTLTGSTGNLQWYQSTTPGGALVSISGATNTPVSILASAPGTVYLNVIASSPGCPSDTTNTSFTVTINPMMGDMVCNPIPLTIGSSNTYYNTFGATVQSGEVVPPNTGLSSNNGWGSNNTLDNTLWFTFTAPASGNVSVQSPDFDTQLAVWSTPNCTALVTPTNAILIGANDDDSQYTAHNGSLYSSYVRALCLTPGATYYIQLDGYSSAVSGDSTRVLITDLGTNSFTGPASSYCLPSTASASLVANIPGGAFTIDTNTSTVTAFTPSVAGVGTHTIYYNVYGCISNSIVTVNNNPLVSITGNSVVCSGSSITLTASGANSYSWSTGSTSSTTFDAPTVNTTYSVTGTNTVTGCSGNASQSVTVNNLPVVSISGSSTVCEGTPSNLTASGAVTYSWNTGATGSSFAPTPSVTTSYTVTGTDNNNCSDTASFMVTVNPNPTVTVTGGAICPGDSFTLSPSGASTYTYLPNGPVVSPGSTTTYTVSGTDAFGCISQTAATAIVTVTNNLTVNVSGNTTLCSGQSASLTAGGASTYSWNTGASTSTVVLTPTVNTTYSVTGSSGSCSNTAVVTITVNALPSVALSASSNTLCDNGQTVTLTGSPAGGVYSGSNVSGNIFTSTAAGTFTPVYSYTDGVTGCSNTANTSLVVSVCTGITKLVSGMNALQVYPNPTIGEFTIELTNGMQKNVEVTDLTGRTVFAEVTGKDKLNVNISSLANGVYFVKVQSNNAVEVIKVVKQ